MPDRWTDIAALHLDDDCPGQDCAGVDTALIAWLAAREERRPKSRKKRAAAAGAVFNREDDEPWTTSFVKR